MCMCMCVDFFIRNSLLLSEFAFFLKIFPVLFFLIITFLRKSFFLQFVYIMFYILFVGYKRIKLLFHKIAISSGITNNRFNNNFHIIICVW